MPVRNDPIVLILWRKNVFALLNMDYSSWARNIAASVLYVTSRNLLSLILEKARLQLLSTE